MFYDSFISICEDRGISPTKVLVELDISKGSLSRWRDGGNPTNETKKKIADYFGVSVKDLMSGEAQEQPAINNDSELTEYLEELSTRPEMKMLFKVSKGATKEQVEQVVKMFEAFQK